MITILIYETIVPAALAIYPPWMSQHGYDGGSYSRGGSGSVAGLFISLIAIVAIALLLGIAFEKIKGFERSKKWIMKILCGIVVGLFFGCLAITIIVQVLVMAYIFWPTTILVALVYLLPWLNSKKNQICQQIKQFKKE